MKRSSLLTLILLGLGPGWPGFLYPQMPANSVEREVERLRQEIRELNARLARQQGQLDSLRTAGAPPSGERDELMQAILQGLEAVKTELDSLWQALPLSPAVNEEELERLEERLERQLRELEGKIDTVARASAPTIFNPRTTVFINGVARSDSRAVVDAEGEARIDDRIFLRSLELDLRAPVDPYAEGVAILSLENEAGETFEADPEEVYGVIKRLPLLERAPWGLKIKAGKFRAPLGVVNKLHLHDLMWTTRPLPIARYLGTEHGEFFESGYNPVGVDLDFFLPNPFPQSTLEMNLEVLRGGDLKLSQGQAERQPAYLAHLSWFKPLGDEHTLTAGLSTYQEVDSPSARLYAADLTYKWRPLERGQWKSFVAGAELFYADHRFREELSEGVSARRQHLWGGFAYAQYQLSWSLYMGVRYDWVEEPLQPDLRTRLWGAYANYYTSEFLRFRLGVEHRESDLPQEDNRTSGFFELNLVFGSHPVEPYWVSR